MLVGNKGVIISTMTHSIHGYMYIRHLNKNIKSLAPDCNLTLVNSKHILRMDIVGISCEIAIRWIQQDLTNDW